jgi:hypothetical protein
MGLFLLFGAGIAMVGAIHQALWLVSANAPESTAFASKPPWPGFIAHARDQARQSDTTNGLKQIGLALHNTHDAVGQFPPGGSLNDRGRLLHGWAIHLGEYAGFSTAGIDFQIPWNEQPNAQRFRCALPIFISPAIPQVFDRDGYGLSHFAGNVHVLPITRVSPEENGIHSILATARDAPDSDRRDLPFRISDITDGTSNTLLVGQSAGNYKPWGHPTNVREPGLGLGTSADGFGGTPDNGTCLFLMCDGSVRSISHEVDRRVLTAFGTPRGGEQVDLTD